MIQLINLGLWLLSCASGSCNLLWSTFFLWFSDIFRLDQAKHLWLSTHLLLNGTRRRNWCPRVTMTALYSCNGDIWDNLDNYSIFQINIWSLIDYKYIRRSWPHVFFTQLSWTLWKKWKSSNKMWFPVFIIKAS